MNNGRANINYELVAKYLAGELAAPEQKEFEQWVAASEENKLQFTKLKKLWNKAEYDTDYEPADVNVDKAWATFQEKAAFKSKRQARVIPLLLRVAAAIVVGWGIYHIYQNFAYTEVENKQLITSSTIKTDTLADGSVVTVNQHSKLTYPQEFSGNERNLSLEGEAFFKVKPDAKKPFKVNVEGLLVTVLGTSFYIKAYDSLNTISIGVEEGRVKVFKDNHEVILEGGQQISLSDEASETAPVERYNPNNIFWKSKTLVFQNESLSAVFERLGEAYGLKIDVDNQAILNCRLTGKFKEEPPARIFDIVDTNFGFTTNKKDGVYIVSGDGCP